MPIYDGSEIQPKNGYDIITTINVNLQDIAESALLKGLELNDADYGSVILMEVKTGEIKAISNFSKNKSGDIISKSLTDTILFAESINKKAWK